MINEEPRRDGTASILDVMPLGVAVVDLDGVVTAANSRLADVIGLPVDDLLGRSLLDFVDPADAAFAREILAAGLLYVDEVMGPVRVRYRDAEGRPRFTEFWARNCVDVSGVGGYVLTLAEESTADKLSDAIRSIAAGEPVASTLGHVTSAMAAHPVVAVASVLLWVDDDLVPVGDWPIDPTLVDGSDRRSPWRAATRRGEPRDFVDLHGLPDPVRAAARAAGFSSVWVRPIATEDGAVAGVLVLWRPAVGWPSPNQERRIADAVAIASLALDQDAYRASMRDAVFVDVVTGVGTRARLADVANRRGAEPCAVLYVDLDGFKQVNDRYGHAIGDLVLAEVGERLAGSIRDDDEVIRVGGDEFVLICRSPATLDATAAVAERVVAALALPFEIGGAGDRVVVALSGSVGLAPDDGCGSLMDRVRLADLAMYDAKLEGKNRWRATDRPPRASGRAEVAARPG